MQSLPVFWRDQRLLPGSPRQSSTGRFSQQSNSSRRAPAPPCPNTHDRVDNIAARQKKTGCDELCASILAPALWAVLLACSTCRHRGRFALLSPLYLIRSTDGIPAHAAVSKTCSL